MTVVKHEKPGYPPSYTNKGTLEPKPVTSKKRMTKMLASVIRSQDPNYKRKQNAIIANQRQERDLLRRDLMRGHHTTRVKRAFRKAARETEPKETAK